jgi:hypothetical protein
MANKLNWEKAASDSKWAASNKEFVKPHTLEKYEKKQSNALKNKIKRYTKAKHKASRAGDDVSVELIGLAIDRLKLGISLKQTHRNAFNKHAPPKKKRKSRTVWRQQRESARKKKAISGKDQYDAYLKKLGVVEETYSQKSKEK